MTKKENSYPVGVYLICRARIGGTEIYRGGGGQKFIGGQKWTSTFTPAYTYVVARIRVMVWANVMVEVLLVFLQSLCITCSCCIFEVRDSYGNVVVIVSMKKCLKMQTETAIRVVIWVSLRFLTMWHNFGWNFFVRIFWHFLWILV